MRKSPVSRAHLEESAQGLVDKAAGHWAEAHAALMALANPEKAAFLAGFFKTGKGQYAEGDQFLGITVPAVRQIAKDHGGMTIGEGTQFLESIYNEERFLGLLVLIRHYEKGDAITRETVYRNYMEHRHRINNWNLVDGSAPQIPGEHWLRGDRAPLWKLAHSASLWDRRIAVLASLTFIRAGDHGDTLKLIGTLLGDTQDLMHKACGWMLREIGKRDQGVLEEFLEKHRQRMPRTMLRYAIEHFSTETRATYLKRQVM
jgi:3-methyladenine DNA glycosylase AlkD